jgi:hypothetical protein
MKLPPQISKLDYWVYGLSLALCFLLFKQSDLTHTNASSFAYLYGHFWDFYDYNSNRMGDNNYLPIFYWFFAIWNIPLKLLGFIPEVTSETWMQATVIQTIWSKLLLAIFFFASVSLVRKIANQICITLPANQELRNERIPELLFATSPIAIFAIFIFGGYDIFALFFMLLGLHAYFSKDFKWFVVWFSVAISFKYFAAFAYLPLVLIIEKRLIYLAIYGLFGLLITAVQFALYWHSDVFTAQIFGLATAKATGNGINIRFLVANSFYLGMCAYLYFSKLNFNEDTTKWQQRAITACILSYALLFSWVLWHPQWVILITPFTALSYLFIRNQKTMLFIEILGYLGFAVYCMNNWVGNVDNTMLSGGVFADLLPPISVLASDITGRHWMPLSRILFYGFLYFPCLLLAYQYLSNFKEVGKKQSSIDARGWLFGASEKTLFNLRFLTACYFYIAISALCFW